MKLEVSHRTTYSYRTPVAQSHHVVHLKPRTLPGQTVLRHSLLIDPAPVARTEILDYFGNVAELLRIEEQHVEFIVHARSTVEMTPSPKPSLEQSPAWEEIAGLAATPAGLGVDVAQ